MGRANRSEEKRAQILKAFEICLRRYGPDQCTIQTVAREADVPQGSVLFFFKSKEALLIAFYDQLYEGYLHITLDWADSLDTTITSFDGFYTSFRAFMRSAYAPFEAEQTVPINYAAHYFLMEKYPEVKKRVQEWYAKIADAFVIAQSKTQLSCKNPLLLAYMMMGLQEGFGLMQNMSGELFSLLSMVDCLGELLG